MGSREADEALDMWACTREGKVMGWIVGIACIACAVVVVVLR